MPKRDLSPESRERRDRPLQQQKSISDIIGPMVAKVNLDMTSNEFIDSMANTNATTAEKESRLGSTGSSRQNSSEGDSLDNIVEESCVAMDADPREANFTDVGGRIGDALRAGKQAAKKAVKSVAKEVETVVHETIQVAKNAAGEFEDVVVGGIDMVACGINKVVGFADLAEACVLQKQISLEEKPSNNVYISHPTKGAANMVPMGMHITHHTFKNGSGQIVLMVEPGKLAEQAALKECDVIIAVGDKDVSKLPLEDAICVFGNIDSTFSMTVIRNEQPDEEVDIPSFIKKTITVEVHLNDDNVVAIKVIDITCTQIGLWYVAQSKVVFQHQFEFTDNPYFMQVHNDGLRMFSTSDDKGHFWMNRYSDSDPLNGCTAPIALQNNTKDKVVTIFDPEPDVENSSLVTVTLKNSTDVLTDDFITLQTDTDRQILASFFLLHNIENGDILLESAVREGYFLAVDEDSTTNITNADGEITSTQQLIVCHPTYTNRDDLDLSQMDQKYRFKYVLRPK